MKVILDIDSNALEIIKKDGIINSENKINNMWVVSELIDAFDNAVILPDNATNGDVIKAMFPDAYFEEYEDEWRHIVIMWAGGKASTIRIDFEWELWNAPYKGWQEAVNKIV